jgi:hypothetical protein
VVLAASSHSTKLASSRTGADETAKVGLIGVEEGEATGVSEARSYEGFVGRKRPRSRHPAGETCPARGLGESKKEPRGAASPGDPPKRFGRRENVRISGQAASIPESVRRPRGESRGSESRKHTRCGCTQFVRVAEVDRTHRASCPPGGRKSSWRPRQGASRKEARSTV